ncbi:MAG TPA: TonB family protein [Geobacteraceae bacterium]|nr:TonB family protein [Geobacteraceae bacterium]
MRHRPKKDFGLVSAVACSLFVHLAFLTAFCFLDFFRTDHMNTVPVYYVDIVNLPVADPRAGSPSNQGSDARPAAPEPRKEEMRSPANVPQKLPVPIPEKKKRETSADTDRDFTERLARLQKKVEGQHTEDAIEKLRKKVAAGSGRAGMPGGTGTEAGSDYGSYIQSRLRDAFEKTIVSRSGNPMAVVRLTIDRFGKIAGYRIERSSGDKAFDDSVIRAIYLAEENIPPPPGRKNFQQGFIFKPEGVGKK